MKKILLTLAGVGLCLALYFTFRQTPAPVDPQVASPLVEAPEANKSTHPKKNLLTKTLEKPRISELDRSPLTEEAATELELLLKANERFERYRREGYGKLPKVDLNNPTPQITSVVEALQNKTHPERLSLNVNPPEFDEATYLKDPSAYCAQHVPARCFQSAQPVAGIKKIKRENPYYQEVIQGTPVTLSVKIAPGMPATFTATQGGLFLESRLGSITVQADSSGYASATFVPTTGTIEDCQIICASPSTLSAAKSIVSARLPEKAQ